MGCGATHPYLLNGYKSGFLSMQMDTNLDTLDTNLRFVSGFVSIDFWIRIHRPMRCRSRSRHGPSCMIPNQADAFNLWFLKGVTCGCSYYFAEDKNHKKQWRRVRRPRTLDTIGHSVLEVVVSLVLQLVQVDHCHDHLQTARITNHCNYK